MLKTRIVGVLVVRNGMVVQSIAFQRYLPVGRPEIAVEYLNRWGIDEIVLLDIDVRREGRGPRYERVEQYARHCHVPLTMGGGIDSVSDMEMLLRHGADKVSLNTTAVERPEIIREGAGLFGNQCIMVSLDVRRLDAGRYEVFTRGGENPTGRSPAELAKASEGQGAGEILLTSIDRDGSKQGYDLELLGQVTEAVSIPVIACGGANHPDHFLEASRLDLSGLAAANFFHYTEHSVITLKRHLLNSRRPVRIDTYATYEGFDFDPAGRVQKLDDEILEDLRFEYIPEEVI